MNTIRNYLESMFINLPETAELQQIKADILANMEDKYTELRQAGFFENEAIGQVISEFGNIDEVLEAIGLEKETENFETETSVVPEISLEDALEIIDVKRKIGIKIGFGVIACCFALATFFLLNSYGSPALGLTLLILLAAIGVGLFIVAGFQNSKYEYLEKTFVITGTTRRELETIKKNFDRSFMFSIVAGVSLCMVSVLPLIFFAITEGAETTIMRSLAVMFVVASAGVFLFIYAGLIHGTHELLLTKALLKQPTEQELKRQYLARKIDAVVWPLITVVFFIWGFFLPGGFGISWIVFVIGGVLSEIWSTE